jgi:hypothetical protein
MCRLVDPIVGKIDLDQRPTPWTSHRRGREIGSSLEMRVQPCEARQSATYSAILNSSSAETETARTS